MNLLMILLIILGIWVSAAICYFAWQVMPKVEPPPDTVEGAEKPPAAQPGRTEDSDARP